MRSGRALTVALVVLCAAFAAFYLRQHGTLGSLYPGCLFYKTTGLYCPGCGMTRAAFATMHGDISRAFRMNPVGMVLLPLAIAGLSGPIAGWVAGRPPLWKLELKPFLTWTVAITVIAFWILRNIPVWPFTLLAPY